MAMARTQTLVQLSDELLAQLDARAAQQGRSRSELIREAIAGYLVDDREVEIDRRIVESYTRRPQEDLLGAEATARAMVDAEPWEDSARTAARCGGWIIRTGVAGRRASSAAKPPSRSSTASSWCPRPGPCAA
jgi:predicted DNA-binding protein